MAISLKQHNQKLTVARPSLESLVARLSITSRHYALPKGPTPSPIPGRLARKSCLSHPAPRFLRPEQCNSEAMRSPNASTPFAPH